MTKEDFIDDFEEKQTIAMTRLDAYRKVKDSVKRMYESSERKVKEVRADLGKYGFRDLWRE